MLAVALALPARGAELQMSSGSLTAVVNTDPWQLTFRDGNGLTVLAEHPGTGAGPSGRLGFRTAQGWAHATRVAASGQIGDRSIARVETNDPDGRQLEVVLAPDGEGVIRVEAQVILGQPDALTAVGIGWHALPDERFFGFGERATAVDQRGNTIENYVSDGPYWPEERSLVAMFVPAPGFRFRDDATYFPVPWLLSSRGYGLLIDNADPSYFRLGTDEPDAWSLEVVGTPDGMAALPSPRSLRFRVFAGPRPRDVLRRFTQRVGRQPPPEAPWVLGPWFQPGGSLDNQMAQVQKLQNADAPLSVVQTYTHYLPCGSQVGRRDAERQRTGAVHARGLAITTYFNPMICESYAPRFAEAAAADALMRTAAGQPYIYNYTGSTIFRVGQFDFSIPAGRNFYQQLLGEAVEDGHDGWMEDFGEYTPFDAFTSAGAHGSATHNTYVVDYHCAGYEFTQQQTRPIARFQRSGWTGVAPCAASRLGYTKLRTALYPYIVAAAAEYQSTGLPIMRHLALEAPDDPQATARDDELLFGPALLAAPVLAPGQRARDVYLPAGSWIDLWRAVHYQEATGELVVDAPTVTTGATTLTVPAPLEELPLFVRAGSVLPLLPSDVDTLASYVPTDETIVTLAARADQLRLLAFPRGRSRARFYQRDVVRSSERAGGWDLVIRGTQPRRYQLDASLATLKQPFAPCAVEWNGVALPEDAWSYAATRTVLHAEVDGLRGRLRVRRTCAPSSP